MNNEEIVRKNLESQQFLELRQATEKIAGVLDKGLKSHLSVLKSLFIPRKLLGTYIKSAAMEEVPGSNKAFAKLQEQYAAICDKPFGLSKKLHPPLPPISNHLEATAFQYSLSIGGSQEKVANITCPTKWILSYRSERSLNRLKAMLSGAVSRQADDMKQTLIDHLVMVVFLKHFRTLTQLLEDLRYEVETIQLNDLGGLPVVVLKAPLETFLPPDDFILQVTQLSGIPAFQEIIDLEAVENIPDPLKESFKIALTK
ncbi:MAG: hypothetical protein HF982_07870 [Desulfobacteraceae bacterium]|nr:hypothetical protein [Desulfobacteraceae bacterium]MBC2719487.1 hypothetical protein [Desulfobacteraceae bacterium]